MKPSLDPVAKNCPSDEKAADSAWDLGANWIFFAITVGHCSSSSAASTATPRKTLNFVFEGIIPMDCCQVIACPTKAKSRDGGATSTCLATACARVALLLSLGKPSYTCAGSWYCFLTWCSSLTYRCGWSFFMAINGAVSLIIYCAISRSFISVSSRTTCVYRSCCTSEGKARYDAACNTASHLPWVMSLMRPSKESTAFSDTLDSSCRVCKVRYSPFSLQNCSMSLMMSELSTVVVSGFVAIVASTQPLYQGVGYAPG
mmetsp:Transcript_15532/g.35551  ORF Transcript_15532/g.35551 Transcript_15532/m.35551 type:complete len:259 (-) Transcript_15532:17-793(-)